MPTAKDFAYLTSKLVMPEDTNPSGKLFGGRALAWIDEAAAIFAYRQLKYPKQLVTKFMSAIDFTAPGELGNMVEIGCRVVGVGRTSISVELDMRNMDSGRTIVHIEKIVFINLVDGVSAPHGFTEADLMGPDASAV